MSSPLSQYGLTGGQLSYLIREDKEEEGGLLGGSIGKESACNDRDPGLIPG